MPIQNSTNDILTVIPHSSVLILGLGTEGWSTYRFLRQRWPDLPLAVADQRLLQELSSEQQATLQQDQQTTLLLGADYLDQISRYSLIFKAPGIPRSLPAIQTAVTGGTRLSSNTELFFALCPGKIIGITGTKGKSTTSAVIHHVLQAGGLSTVLVGNIGTPALDTIDQIQADTLVVFELSSHQLELLHTSPHIAIIQDITTEHLDYYATTEEYQAAKAPIASFQRPEDVTLYNADSAVATRLAAASPGKHLSYGLSNQPAHAAYVEDNTIYWRDSSGQAVPILETSAIPLPGKHNQYNVLPAVIVGALHDLTIPAISQALRSFRGLPHRLELVHEEVGVRFYDDSLATNPFATIQALESFDGPVVLIAGGYERQQDFGELAAVIARQNLAGLVLFRPTGERLAGEVEQAAQQSQSTVPPTRFVESMTEAVQQARQLMPSTGGVILMSPASASFGRFKDYRDRGLQFQEAVKTSGSGA